MDFRLKVGLALVSYFAILGFLMLPVFYTSWFSSLAPPIAWGIYSVAIIMGTYILSAFLLGEAHHEKQLKLALVLFVFYELLDWFEGPQAIRLDGSYASDAGMWNASIDAFVGWIYKVLGVPDVYVYDLVYKVTPILMVVFFLLILSKSELRQVIRKVLK